GELPHSHILPFPHSLRLLRESGFNRLSLGVQSFNYDELRLLGRIHTADEAIRAFREARDAGFENVSIDLMYGIPGQTLESWSETLDKALDLAPEHVSLYSLTVEEGTPFHAMQVEGRLTLPGDDLEADMYEEAIRVLTGAGFEHYEISNFARPGFRCRHNITYWRNEPYFGFGAGAASLLNGTRSTNVSDPEEYIIRVEAGQDPKACEERLTGKAAMGETMFLGLRMLQGVDIESFARRYGVTAQEVFFEEIADLAERGLIEESDGAIRLTPRGLLLANDVFAEFVCPESGA
ncbi:MAG: radical SAM family heme chaperone HemW, partial [Armatimonadetes bacterium]|nr:radical SAM family heme chaperone HemW [Armatimonadota bacterium]